MKGTNEVVTDAIFIMGVLLFLILLIQQIVPQMLNLFNQAAVDSSDFVAKEMSELVTVSGAAPYQIDITYSPTGAKYNLNIQNGILQTDLLKSPSEIQKTSAAKIANDASGSFSDVNIFYISKNTGGTTIGAN